MRQADAVTRWPRARRRDRRDRRACGRGGERESAGRYPVAKSINQPDRNFSIPHLLRDLSRGCPKRERPLRAADPAETDDKSELTVRANEIILRIISVP
jgi:hypothetical protein